jgi:hypothetical protein
MRMDWYGALRGAAWAVGIMLAWAALLIGCFFIYEWRTDGHGCQTATQTTTWGCGGHVEPRGQEGR